MDLKFYKEKTDNWINNYYEAKKQDSGDIINPMIYSLKIGGKRIRPILMECTYKMYGDNLEEILPFAGAMEMIHTYSLVHDDLPCMDNDDLRRGKPTNHKVFGEAFATLAGDSLLNEAMNIMFKECLKGDLNKIKASYLISVSSGIDGMIKGQIIDIESEGKRIDETTLYEMHRNKTGMLIKASILAGAMIGGAPQKDVELLEEFGEKLGLAFQVKDDILDVTGDAALLGKSQSDAENEKTTFITMYGLERCKELCEDLTNQCYEILEKIDRDTSNLYDITKFLLERNY